MSDIECSNCGLLYKAGAIRGCPNCNPKPEEKILNHLHDYKKVNIIEDRNLYFLFLILIKYFKAKVDE